MNEFCIKVKKEIKPFISKYTEHKKYIGNKESVEYKEHLRKTFMECGYIANPYKEYDLEIAVDTIHTQERIKKELSFFDLDAKTKMRGKKFLVYIKKADSISYFLSIIGAGNSVIEFENIRIEKTVSIKENRKVNAEIANMKKTITAKIKHDEMFKTLFSKYKKETISANILELYETRKKYPNKSFSELAEIMNMSKSNINNMFRKIEKMLREC